MRIPSIFSIILCFILITASLVVLASAYEYRRLLINDVEFGGFMDVNT